MSRCEVVFNEDKQFLLKVRLWHVRALGTQRGRGVPVPPCSPSAAAGDVTAVSSLLGLGLASLNLVSGDNLPSWKTCCGLEKGRVWTCLCVPFRIWGL